MMNWIDAAKQGALIAGIGNVVLIGMLLLTRRWWSLPGAGASAPSAQVCAQVAAVRPGRLDFYFWIGLAMIVVGAAVLRVPLARSSLWWDEVWQARNASVGEWRPDRKDPGEWRFRETTFAQALWNYRKPANHPPMAVASKACHEVWRKLTGAAPGAFNEFVLRFPGFVASLAGIALVALLLRAWGSPVGGLSAALFLALHPWHIRYGIDCRGYAFLPSLTLIGLWSLWRACGPIRSSGPPKTHHTPSAAAQPNTAKNDHPLSWWLFGFTQSLILWSHLLSVWVCLALSTTGLWWIWCQHTGRDRWRRLARFAAVQVAGAMLFFQLFLPNLLQVRHWGEKNQDGRLLDWPVLADTMTQVALGGASTSMAPYATVFVLALAIIGLIVACRARVPGAAGLVGLSVGAALFLTAVWAADFYFYPRFLFALVVPLVMALAIRPHWFILANPSVKPFVMWSPSLGAVLGIGMILSFGLPSVLRRGFSPLRETAAVLRDGAAEGAHVFGYGFGAEALQYYFPVLPYAREADASEVLAAAIESARAAGKPLLVATGYEELNRLALPAGFEQLDDPAQFQEVWAQAGLESQFAYRIRRFDPAAAASTKTR
ncbi:MAG: hypothetical protein ACKV19_20045 [Verrucomicrobiales bacterium]